MDEQLKELLGQFDSEIAEAPAGRNTSVNHTYNAGEYTGSQVAEAIAEYGLVARPDVVKRNRDNGNTMSADFQGKGKGLTVYDSGKVCTRGFSL
jgi:hypothetical protein